MLARGQQLHGQGRAVDHFTPAPAVVGLADPVAPELQGACQAQIGGTLLEAWVARRTEQELGGLVLLKGELRDRAIGINVHGLIGAQSQGRLVGSLEDHVILIHARAGVGTGVVMAHRATHVEGGAAADHADPPHQQWQVVLGVADRQQVGDLDHRPVTEPAGLQHVGVGQVNLFATGVGQVR
ncbi:hypothetical protein D3C71_1478150 [compost metagenome]